MDIRLKGPLTFVETQDTMDSSASVLGKLPVEIIERVLSFLPVPDLCRIRCVCKTWNEIIGRPSFHDLCDLNGKNNVYLSLWGDDLRGFHGFVAPITVGALSFLDLDAERWYSIQATEIPRFCACISDMESRLMAMDDGLVCELSSSQGTENDRNFVMTLTDPVAKTSRILPAPPTVYSCSFDDTLPLMVPVVDDVTRSYKVFLLNNLSETRERQALPRVYVHDSHTDDWRAMGNVPNDVVYQWADSAVSLHQTVFVVGAIISDSEYGYDQLRLVSHNVQGDSWAEVWRMSFRRTIRDPQLVVSDSRLFVSVWSDLDTPEARPVSSDCPNSESLFQTNQDYRLPLFEMYEILIAENSRKPVVQLTLLHLQLIFGNHDPDLDLAYAYPCLDSSGTCDSVVLVSRHTGQIRRYYLATISYDILPPHPSLQTSEDSAPVFRSGAMNLYEAKTTKLSLRNLLAQRPMTSLGGRTVQ